MADSSQVNLRLTPGELLIGAGAIVTFVFSFFHFYTAASVQTLRGTVSIGNDVSAWSSGLVPVATLIVFFTAIMGIQVILTRLANLDVGPGIAGFTWVQIHVALGFFAVIDSLAFLIVDKGGRGVGIGLIFMLIGSIACLVGAILLMNERANA